MILFSQHADNPKLKCPECDYRGQDTQSIERHMAMHGPPKFKCPIGALSSNVAILRLMKWQRRSPNFATYKTNIARKHMV